MNPIAFEIGPLAVRWYAVMISLGIVLAILVGLYLCKEFDIDKDDLLDGVTFGIPIGIIGARIYYVIFEWEKYKDNWIDIIKINEGGLAIHGAIIAAFIYVYYFTKKRKINFLRVADTAAVGFIIAQAMGRWGNFINQEAHGPRTTLEFLQSLHLPNFIIEGMYIGGQYYHPTFLYESVWNIIGFVVIIIFIKKFKAKPGSPVLLYLIWYSIGRYMIEGLRTDSLMFGGFKVAQLISILLIIGSVICWYFKNKYLLKKSD